MKQFRKPPGELLADAEGKLSAASLAPSNEDTMADDKTKRGQPDRSKINMSEDFEVKYWLKALGVSKSELQRAVEKVGNSAAAVRKELGV